MELIILPTGIGEPKARTENQLFTKINHPFHYYSQTFANCGFKDVTVSAEDCDYHDCYFINVKVRQLTGCRFYNCKFTNCDFSDADLVGTETHPGSPTTVSNCKWIGATVVLDCRFFAGLTFTDDDPYLFLLMATIPMSPVQNRIKQLLPMRWERIRDAVLALPLSDN